MCYKEKTKYTYLSMCSCCNVVSKYTSVVKKHLLEQHKTLPGTLVIPIRVENKFERKIKRTLDSSTAKESIMKKKRASIVTIQKYPVCSKVKAKNVASKGRVNQSKESKSGKTLVKCVACNDLFNDCIRYLCHLFTTHINCNIKVSFKCMYCSHTVQYCKDMQDHLEKKHNGKGPVISLIECLNVEISTKESLFTQKHCPYCELKFNEVGTLHDHVIQTHEDNIESLPISKMNTEAVEKDRQQKSGPHIVFRCPSCPKSFHTLQDIWEHTDQKHVPNTYGKPTRKRKPPKWMENDYEEIKIKKTRNVNTTKDGNNMGASTRKTKKDKENFKRKCEICSYEAKNDKAFLRHMSSDHSNLNLQSQTTKKDKEIKENLSKEVKQIHRQHQDSVPSKSNPLDIDKFTFERVVDNIQTENFDAKQGTYCDTEDDEAYLNVKNNESYGDSDDDYEPSNRGSDTEEMVEDYEAAFKCVNCEKSFVSKQSLYKHSKLKHSTRTDIGATGEVMKINLEIGAVKRKLKESEARTEDKEILIAQYKCPFCELKLHHYEYIKSHVIQCHPEITNFRLNTKEMVKAELINEDDWESFKCPNLKCDATYKRKHLLKEHIATCSKVKLGKEKEEMKCTLPRAWIEKLEKSVSLICPYCESVINGKVLFETHLKQHYHHKVFEVELTNTLSSHVDKERDKWPDLDCSMCPYCDVVTTKKIQLTKHIKRFHSNETDTDVISCILVNKTSFKDQAKLIVKDKKNAAKYENENSKMPRTAADEEENAENITRHTMEINKNGKAFPNELISDSNEISSELQEEEKQDDKFETVSIQSTIPCGKYICPLCDFKTVVKKEIKTHINGHKSQYKEGIDSIYTIPDSWIKVDKDSRQPFKCQLCDHEDVNLTLAFRHVLNSHKDIVKETSSDLHASEELFEIVKVEIEGAKEIFEREKYRCSTCVPGHIFKSKKGLQLHLKTRHTDTDSITVHKTMYEMLDLISDSCNTRQIIICCLCNKELLDITDLQDHFNQDHADKLDELKQKLKISSNGMLSLTPTCEICCKQLVDAKSLKHHLILHMNKYKPMCTLCDTCFINHAELERHNFEVHSKAGEMCDICGAMFLSTAKLKRHVKWHETGKSLTSVSLCQYCGTTLLSKNMKKHLVDKHIDLITCQCEICTSQQIPKWKKSVQCDECDAVFCTWYVLKAHKYKEHVDLKGMSFKCRNCNSSFQNKREQFLHSHKCGKHPRLISTKLGSDESDCLNVDIENNTDVNVSVEANIDFSLGLAYVKQEYIIVDKNSEQPYSCKLCGKSFTKMRYICNHLRRMHTKDETKPYRCKVCKMGFVGKKDFVSHCRTHIGLRQFQCKICQKMYKTAAHLKEHSQIHSLQTYSCEFCGLEFRQRGALLSHVVHHDKLKPFKCLYCNKGYSTHGDLQRHMNSYSKDSEISGAKHVTFCSYCSKDLPNHKALAKHFQIHLPINPFQCSVCESKFASFREMYSHKSRKKHFTELEKEEGRQDLRAPGNRFRKYQISKSKTELSKTNKGTIYMEDPVSDSAFSIIADDQNIVEIEIDSSVAECDDRSKAVIDMFENDVIKSMLDADQEIQNTVEFCDTDTGTGKDNQPHGYSDKSNIQEAYQIEIQEDNNYQADVLTMQNMYVAVRHDAYTNDNVSSQNKTTVDNSETLASIVAEGIQQQDTAAGKTQTFQMPDGSIIHVCVMKPDK